MRSAHSNAVADRTTKGAPLMCEPTEADALADEQSWRNELIVGKDNND